MKLFFFFREKTLFFFRLFKVFWGPREGVGWRVDQNLLN